MPAEINVSGSRLIGSWRKRTDDVFRRYIKYCVIIVISESRQKNELKAMVINCSLCRKLPERALSFAFCSKNFDWKLVSSNDKNAFDRFTSFKVQES